MRRIILGLFLLGLAGGGYWYWRQSGSPASAKPAATAAAPAVLVVTRVVEQKPMPVDQAAIGTVQPLATVTVRTRVDGQIVQAFVAEGQEVKAGDQLFQLDTSLAEAQLRQAEGTLARDRAQLERARSDARRYADLARSGVATQQKFEQAVTDSASLDASIKSDVAAIDSIKLSIAFAQIRAPIDGRIGTLPVKPGVFVRQADNIGLVTITQLRPINVSFNIPERALTDVRAAAAGGGKLPVKVRVPGDAARPVFGELTFIDSQVDVTSGTILLKGTFDNTDNRLWPGQYVDVTMTTRVEPTALVIPAEALQINQDGSFVFVVRPDATAEQRPVTVARTGDGVAVIAKGIAAGEKVVIDGMLRLVNGIKTVEQAPAPLKPVVDGTSRSSGEPPASANPGKQGA